ncbi:hypothetical protein Q8A67_019735 [Cirrhinus molitorella]|uniref:Uncharacterized protein n=1 Tax=Cirrhinus molitorella TaxID=172907 RepID=A0AA88PEP2_9TELE|nr:hypothetical protein Q8A67_019735 [Cirrhinus molitorella]
MTRERVKRWIRRAGECQSQQSRPIHVPLPSPFTPCPPLANHNPLDKESRKSLLYSRASRARGGPSVRCVLTGGGVGRGVGGLDQGVVLAL